MNMLNGNKLKLIALISMTIDHVGKILFPSFVIFNIVGRLSFPIFAYMIAEGWKYTSNKKRYMITIWGMGILYQIIYYIFYSSLYMGIFITYGLSLLFIYAIEYFINKKKLYFIVSPIIIVSIVFIGCVEYLLPYRDFAVDYGLVGVAIPVVVYFSRSKSERLCLLFLLLCSLVFIYDIIQIFTLLSVLLLFFYNGKRGSRNLKYFFYIYYPLHLLIIWFISLYV